MSSESKEGSENSAGSAEPTAEIYATGPTPPPRTGRWVALIPVLPQHVEFLYQLATDERSGFRWRLTGSVPPLDTFQRDLWKGVFSQFVVVERRSSRPIGTVMAYNVDLHHGFGFLAAAVVPAAQNSGVGIEAVELFVAWLFLTYDLRKLYLEVPEFNMKEMANGLDGLLREEGRLRKHMYYSGQHWDRLILAIYRDEYLSLRHARTGRRLRSGRATQQDSPASWQ